VGDRVGVRFNAAAGVDFGVAIVVVWRIDEEPDELLFRGKIAVNELSFGGKSMPRRMRENKIMPTIINTPVFALFFCVSTVLDEFTGLTARI
jgi:hypothetical protein